MEAEGSGMRESSRREKEEREGRRNNGLRGVGEEAHGQNWRAMWREVVHTFRFYLFNYSTVRRAI